MYMVNICTWHKVILKTFNYYQEMNFTLKYVFIITLKCIKIYYNLYEIIAKK
jgi:hypothetical protein